MGLAHAKACARFRAKVAHYSAGRCALKAGRYSDASRWTMPIGSEGQAQPLLAESFTERDTRISPDGRWLAYFSDETGRPEVSVRSLTGPARRFVVSSGGGDQPVWRRDGAELFFAGPGGRLFAVSVRPGPPFDLLEAHRTSRGANAGLSIGAATKLNVPPLGERHQDTIYDVSRDGRIVYFQHQTDLSRPASSASCWDGER